VRALDAALLLAALLLAAAIAARVLVDPELTYLGGVSTSSLPLGYSAAGVSTEAQRAGYSVGVSTSARQLGYAAAGVSTEAQRAGYLAGLSTGAKRLAYALRCFIYVNNSWYALRLRAVLEDGTPIEVTARVNGTSYRVPRAGLLLNWSRAEPLCAYLDPVASVEFPSTTDGYTLKSVEGAAGGVAAWPPFTMHEVTAVYTAPSAPEEEAPRPTAQPPEEGRPAPEEAPPRGYVFVPPWVYEPLLRWWWLLLLLLLALLLLLWLKKRGEGVAVVIEVPDWARGW
jgi:hypothetical protein